MCFQRPKVIPTVIQETDVKGLCQLDIFTHTFPGGTQVNHENIIKAFNAGLDVIWFSKRFFDDDEIDQLDKALLRPDAANTLYEWSLLDQELKELSAILRESISHDILVRKKSEAFDLKSLAKPFHEIRNQKLHEVDEWYTSESSKLNRRFVLNRKHRRDNLHRQTRAKRDEIWKEFHLATADLLKQARVLDEKYDRLTERYLHNAEITINDEREALKKSCQDRMYLPPAEYKEEAAKAIVTIIANHNLKLRAQLIGVA